MFVKICGVTTEEDALFAVAMGADAIGFVFAPSLRQVSPAAVAHITRRLPAHVLTVGVFRDDLPERVIDVVGRAGLKAAQLHGSERPEEVAQVVASVGCVIKAFSANGRLREDSRGYEVDFVLVDSPEPGSGELFDWRLAEGLPRSRNVILAGGLTAENVASAIERLHPYGVDVSSGVESRPGHKDPRKVRAFIQAAKAAEPEPYEPALDSPYDWQEER